MSCRILESKTNSEIGLNSLLDKIKDKEIIYIGEFHQVPEVLSFQMDIISGLISLGLKPVIGLEMFNVLQQKLLDYYSAYAIPFEQLLGLYETGPEGFDLNHYINLIDTAVENRMKVIGLNIPRTVASAVAKHGLDRKEIECFHLDEDAIKNCSPEYRNAIKRIYERHPHSEITEENFILAQSIKDEMMAETIIHYLPDETIGMPWVVITGRGHIENGLGIPERVSKKAGKKNDALIVAAYEDEEIKEKIADYIVLI